MTRKRCGAIVVLLALGCGSLGCVSLKRTPAARFFHLRALAEPVPAANGAGEIVGVLSARLPGHLQRPQLVTRVAPGELRIDEFLRWAEPLDVGLTRVLAEDLANLLPEHRVLRFPWRAAAAPRCRVLVELSDFGLDERHVARLEGRFTLLPPDRERALAMRPVKLERGPLPAGPRGVAPEAGVDAMSALVADLSREIAAQVRSLPGAAAAP